MEPPLELVSNFLDIGLSIAYSSPSDVRKSSQVTYSSAGGVDNRGLEKAFPGNADWTYSSPESEMSWP